MAIKPIALIFFDVDFFKRINDTYGHKAGDTFLIKIAKIVKINLRTTELLIRWGGDEFIIIVPEASIDTAEAIAKRIQNAVAEIGASISLGIAHGIPGKDFASFYEMITLADEKMYIEKKAKKMNNI